MGNRGGRRRRKSRKPRTMDLRLWLWSRTTSRPVAANRIQGKKVVRDWGAALRGSSEQSPRTIVVGVWVEIVRGSFPHSRAGRSMVRGKARGKGIPLMVNAFRGIKTDLIVHIPSREVKFGLPDRR